MEDTPFTEDTVSTGKRKRSPGDLDDVFIPVLSHNGPAAQAGCPPALGPAEGYPLPKRPRLPPKPPVTSTHPFGIEALSPSILQQIFSYVDPRSLAFLLRVNQRFRSLLDPGCALPAGRDKHDTSALRSQESIWSLSRRRHVGTMPKPMRGVLETTSIALAFGLQCQFCGKLPWLPLSTTGNPWQQGPGSYAVRIIWPFKIRSCTGCLEQRLQKVECNTSPAKLVV